jgi:hypothetical protein
MTSENKRPACPAKLVADVSGQVQILKDACKTAKAARWLRTAPRVAAAPRQGQAPHMGAAHLVAAPLRPRFTALLRQFRDCFNGLQAAPRMR